MSDQTNDTPKKSGTTPPSRSMFAPSDDDQLEQALVEESVAAIRSQPCTVVGPDVPVERALRILVDLEIACLLVAEDDRLLGVFTKRDVLDKVALNDDEVKDQPVSELTTRSPVCVYESDPVAAALCVMASGGHRHVPVLDAQNKITGIVSPLRVTTFLSQFFEQ